MSTPTGRRRFRNYVKGLIDRGQLGLNDRQLFCAAGPYGLTFEEMDMILNQEGY